MKHFITGGAGFFGLHLIDRLLSEDEEVVVYDTAELDQTYRQKPGVSYIKGDIRDKAALVDAMKGCDVIHHNAAVLPVSRSGKFFRDINVGGTRNVVEAALETGAKKVLFVSTSAVYGIAKQLPVTEETPLTPLGEYAHSKMEAEAFCKEFRAANAIDISIIRPRTIIGTGRMGIFGILFDWISAGKRIYMIGNGSNLYQLLSAKDLASACYLAAVKPCRNEDFLVGAQEFGTFRNSLEGLIKHAGTKSTVVPMSAFFVRNTLRILDTLRLSPLVDYHYMTADKPLYFDTSKLQNMLGWKAGDSNISILCETYDWYLENRESLKKLTGTTHRKGVKQGVLKILRYFS
jgi:nucleoside-diphosphate-sugar epimerase